VISAVCLLPYLIYLLHFSLCHLHVVFVASLFLLLSPENNTDTFEQAFKNSADLLDELTDELTKMKEVREQALSNITLNEHTASHHRSKFSFREYTSSWNNKTTNFSAHGKT
jgi:hypothetical protein